MRMWLVAGLAFLAACGTPVSETVAGSAGIGRTWQLLKINGQQVTAPMTIAFLNNGGFEGKSPCKGFTARQVLPLPWFKVESLAVTENACDGSGQEAQFLDVLEEMEFAEVTGDTMVLTGGTSSNLLFRLLPRNQR